MLRLLLLRHAKSDWHDAAARDHDRTLSTRGKTAAPAVGAHMARHGLMPDKVLCSTAQRARETLALVLPHLSGEIDVHVTRGIYDDSEMDYVETIRALGGNARTLMVVGHNPATRDTALELVGSGNPALIEAIEGKYPTAALAIIDFAADRWSDVERESGRIVAYCLPRHLPAAATSLSALPEAANDGGDTPPTSDNDA
ncbi:histidine phosphatase family protein [Stappia sp. ES.058]|uniref:SixA phosphatase family protein n=1 Tax=Stappia sp. ES.058 TaxID=1881061 RepID=UPI00087B3C02|nr:histidine phosphatase family protein [Stappia sp. ES.058]SDU24784.1 phosphohistidine phosphatase [Stappia sp. ES.058]